MQSGKTSRLQTPCSLSASFLSSGPLSDLFFLLLVFEREKLSSLLKNRLVIFQFWKLISVIQCLYLEYIYFRALKVSVVML